MLYELFDDSTSFKKQDLEQAVVLKIVRAIREEEPPRPITILHSALGETFGGVL